MSTYKISFFFSEIQKRILYCILSFILVFVISYIFVNDLYYILSLPITDFSYLQQNFVEDNYITTSFTNKKEISNWFFSLQEKIDFNLLNTLLVPSQDSLDLLAKPIQTYNPVLNVNFPNNTSKPINYIFFDVSEAFYTAINFSILLSFFFVFPYMLYNFWAFLVPSLYIYERKEFTKESSFFVFFFYCSLLSTFFFFFPIFWKFFLSFETIGSALQHANQESTLFQIEYQPRISSYVSFFFF